MSIDIEIHVKRIQGLIIVHTVLLFLYYYLRHTIDLLFMIERNLPMIIFFSVVPLLAVSFLGTAYKRWASILLLGILFAELFGLVYFRFTSFPPYSIHEPSIIVKILYEAAFGCILVIEVVSGWLTGRYLKEIHMRTIVSNQESSVDQNKR